MPLKRTQYIACIAGLLLEEDDHESDKSKKKCWVRPWLERRKEEGCYHNLFQELLVEDTASFQEFIQMDKMHFNYLVEKLYPHLQKTDTVMRESIKPPEQCCLFLRYGASGKSFRSLEYQFRLSRRSISRIISNVAQALIDLFQKQYLRTPSNTEEKMLQIFCSNIKLI